MIPFSENIVDKYKRDCNISENIVYNRFILKMELLYNIFKITIY